MLVRHRRAGSDRAGRGRRPGSITRWTTSAALFDCEPGNPGCGPLQVDTERTTVIHPPVLTGSPKIAIRGLPAGCASSDFKAKAKAKPRKVRSIAVSLSGPRDEFGGLIDGVVSSLGRIASRRAAR